MSEIKVYVFKRENRKNFEVTWTDPITGKMKMVSTRKSTRSDAERFAGTLQKELNEGTYKATLRTTWAEFRNRYEDEKLSGLADKTANKVWATFNAVEEIINPKLLSSLSGQISRFASELRKQRGLAESTIKGHLAHLRAALNWAVREGLLQKAPDIEMPRRAKKSVGKMKGRPITTEEFERMLAKVPEVVGDAAAESWRHYLRGLWLSGLRLEESLNLYWDRDDRLCIDLTGEFPMLSIPAEFQKSHEDQLLAIVPEFAEFLLQTPEVDRVGPVFDPQPKRAKGIRLQPGRVGKMASDIGKAANVKVFTDPKTGSVKFASVHDLRRSFGDRWKTRVMPHTLKELMRHKSIETTNRYYISENAASTAQLLWGQFDRLDTLLDSSPKETTTKTEGLPQP